MEIYRISAVTLIIENMERSCSFYSQIPGFKLVYGGSSDDTFTTFEIGSKHVPKMYLNLELNIILIKKIKTKPLKLKTAISYHNRNLLLAPISSWIRWRQECTIRFLILPGLLVWRSITPITR